MQRSFSYNALTLRVRPSGESNREAWFLTAEEGLIRATVFGGPKSRLRARVAPFHEGTLYIYHDPVRDSRKVTDFDVKSYRPGIRELYERAVTAGALAETILASHAGGGGWPEAAGLAGSVLDALETANAAVCTRLGLYFFWHWAGFLGQRPALSACSSCAGGGLPDSARNGACEPGRDTVLWYSVREEAFFCENCLRRTVNQQARKDADSGSSLRVGAGARLWLKRTESLDPAALARVSLDGPSLEQARAFTQAVLAGVLGKRLSSWDGI